MKRTILVLVLSLISFSCLTSVCLSQDEKAAEAKKMKIVEMKAKGQLIPHPETNDIKILTDDYKTLTIPLDKTTRIEVTVKGTLDFMAEEAFLKLPKGEITYTMVDGKPVAIKVTYSSGETWKMEPPKPPEE
jgi:hypothetical protein